MKSIANKQMLYILSFLNFIGFLMYSNLTFAEINKAKITDYYLSNSIDHKDLKNLWKKYLNTIGADEKVMQEIPITLKDLGGFKYDVDGDGKDDWILSLNHSYVCGGKMHCMPIIFPSSLDGKSIKTCLNIDIGQKIDFLKYKSNGFYNFKVDSKSEVFEYNGEQYCYSDIDNA